MTIEQKLAQALGDLQFKIIVLTHHLEEAQARIAEMSADSRKEPDKKK